jgi:hypothetical protein
MPIDFFSSLRGASNWSVGSPLLNSILGSSLFVAIVVSLIMMLLVMFMYPAKAGTPFSVVAKMFIYMFFGSLLVIFLHDGIIKYTMEEEFTTRDSDAFMQNATMQGRISDPSYADLYKTVAPVAQPVPSPPVVQSPLPTQLARTETDTITGGGGRIPVIKPNRNAYRNPYS